MAEPFAEITSPLRPPGPRNVIPLRIQPWPDLVYHALSYLAIPAQDSSCLFSSEYVAWFERQLEPVQTGKSGVPRTLTEDSAVLAASSAASEQGYLLHAFPGLWANVDEFLQGVEVPWEQIDWADDHRRRLAAALQAHTRPGLVELFRIALWAEVRNGYLAVWETTILPRAQAYQGYFTQAIASLSLELPELQAIRWTLSHPLRQHGRGWVEQAGEKSVAVGVADPELGVPQTHPVIQAVHEYFVLVASERASIRDFSTVPGRPGYEAFQALETAALDLGARHFEHSAWRPAWEEWRQAT
jgi:hypothetical protein